MEEEIIINTEVKGADKSEKQLNDLAKATNKADDAGEKYEKTLGDMAKETQVFGVSLNSLSAGFRASVGAVRNSVKSLKLFKTALAATGVGLLVVALGSLVATLQNTQAGMDFLGEAVAAIGASIKVVTGLFTKLGSVIGKVFRGEASITEGLREFGNEAKNLVSDIKAAANAAIELERASDNLRIQTAANTVQIAKNNVELAKNKRFLEDTTQSIEERIEASKTAAKLIDENGRLEEERATEALRIAREQIELDNEANGIIELRIDQLEKLAPLQAEVSAAQQLREEKNIEFQNKRNALEKEYNTILADQEREIQRIDDLRAKSNVEQLSEIKEIELAAVKADKAIIESMENLSVVKGKIRGQELIDAQILAEQEWQLASDLAGSIASIFGQESVFGKAAAIAQATINTYLGITAGVKLGFPAAIPAVAAATATGFKAVRDIVSTPLPQVQINTTSPFGDGGMIHGDLHSAPSGGVHILAEGGEAVINRRSVAMFKPLLNQINQAGGGVPIMANGGMVPDQLGVNPFVNIERELAQARSVLVLDDLNFAQQSNQVIRVATTL